MNPNSVSASPEKTQCFWRDIFIIGCLSLLLFGFCLGSFPLQVPDEARYAEIAREMVTTGDWVTPHINQIEYFEKPPLLMWLVGSAIKILGVNPWSLRLWPMLLGAFGVSFLYMTAASIYNRQTGWLAALILATSVMYFILAHAITLDLALSVFLEVTLFSFLLFAQSAYQQRRWLWSFYLFLAAAVLTKGLVALVLTGMILLCWMLLTKQIQPLRHFHFSLGIPFFLFLVLPWHLIAQWRHPEFFHFYIIEQHFLRYLTDMAERVEPWWYFFPVLFLGMMPWSVYLLDLKRIHWHKQTECYLAVWVVGVFAFFSLSHSKLMPYILPIFPPLSLLLAIAIALKYQEELPKRVKQIAAVQVILLAVFMLVWPHMDDRPILPVLARYQALRQPEDDLIMFKGFYYDLPVYLGQTVKMVEPVRGELSWGAQQHKPANVLSENAFWALWRSPQRLFVFIDTRNRPALGHLSSGQLLYENERYSLVINHPRS